jgi:hypothetical protein
MKACYFVDDDWVFEKAWHSLLVLSAKGAHNQIGCTADTAEPWMGDRCVVSGFDRTVESESANAESRGHSAETKSRRNDPPQFFEIAIHDSDRLPEITHVAMEESFQKRPHPIRIFSNLNGRDFTG